MEHIKRIQQVLGPGILMAAAAIGVSHLVQSTRAGADFGFQLIILILLANLFKYPFFEYGHRYFVATGKTLLEGYKDLGKGYLYLFLFLNFFTAMASVAAVTFVTGALLQNLIGGDISLPIWCFALFLACTLLLSLGHYKGLDVFIKVLMIVLLAATLAAFISALSLPSSPKTYSHTESAFQWKFLPFFLALMGWMPAPIELSVWQSLWMKAKDQTQNRKTSLKEALIDFNFGYILTVVLAVVFCSLGAIIMHQSGATFSSSPAQFASQIIELYTHALGGWTKPIIAIAAFATMFSTTITLIDAYPRSLAEGFRLAIPNLKIAHRPWLNFWTFLNCGVGLVIIWLLQSHLKLMVDIVTIMAFIAGPIFGWINFRLILSNQVPEEFRPGKILKTLSGLGLIFLVVFCGLFLISRFS